MKVGTGNGSLKGKTEMQVSFLKVWWLALWMSVERMGCSCPTAHFEGTVFLLSDNGGFT